MAPSALELARGGVGSRRSRDSLAARVVLSSATLLEKKYFNKGYIGYKYACNYANFRAGSKSLFIESASILTHVSESLFN